MEVPDEIRRALRLYAEASDEALLPVADPRARAVVSLVTSTYLLVSAMAEASTMLNAGLINEAVLHGVDSTMARLSVGAEKLLDEPDLARAFRVLQVVVAAGMREMIAVSAEVMAREHPEGVEWRT